MAKSKGRNMVVQLGSGGGEESDEAKEGVAAPAGSRAELIEQILLTPVPFSMAVEKLRGFVADHQATIVKIDGNRMELEIIENGAGRRYADRSAAFRLDLRFEEERLQGDPANMPATSCARESTSPSVRAGAAIAAAATWPIGRGRSWPASVRTSWRPRRRNR